MRKRSDGQAELVLENHQVLLVFFVIVALCGAFFSLGYIVGRNTFSSPANANPEKTDAVASGNKPSAMPPASYLNRPQGGPEAGQELAGSGTDLSFYQSLQTDREPALPASGSSGGSNIESSPSESPGRLDALASPSPAILVQVSALTRREDAENLVELLREKDLPVLVTSGTSDPLFHVVVGPYENRQEAERVRNLLEQEGFRPFIRR